MLLSAEHLSINFGSRQLLDDVNFYLNEGDKVGVIGINGTGKSTFLKVLSGVTEPDGGTISRNPNVQVSLLPQNPAMEESATVLEQVFLHFPAEFRELNEYEAKAMLNRLGITDFAQKVGTLSGGQRKRVALAAALIHPADVLILDEPTNHLDSEMVAWLEDWLRRFKGGLVMVTHDRYFLERVVNHITELSRGKLYHYEANYSKYLELREQRFTELSDGQKQRVLLARALCQQPEVIVLDEPTSYLDIRHKIELLDILREMTASRGLSVVLSLHEVDLATKLADVVVLVKDNAIFRCGAPEDVLDDDTIRQLYDIHDGSFNLLLGSVELCGAAGEPRVFVVPGEGRGAPCFRALQKRGLPFAAGILQRCDVDWAVAETLAARRYEAESFSPPAPDTLRAAVAAACSSACVVDSGAAIGPYNRENLELLRAAAGAGVPVLTLRRERLESLEAARPFDTVRALMDEAARLAAGKGGGVCPSSGAASGAIAGTV